MINSVWQIGIIALLAGVLIGVLAYRLFAPSVKQAVKDKAELDAARDELTSYKTSVNAHFNKTSELVNDLTQNYVKVYQHLAEGAHTLGDSKTFNNLLEQHPGKVSLTVDGDSQASKPDASDTIVEAPAEAASVITETPSKDPAAVATPAEPAGDSADASVAASEGEPDGPTETPEPILDANAADETAAERDGVTTADAGSVIPEDEDKTKPSRTVH